MSLKLRNFLYHAFTYIVPPQGRGGEADIFYDPIDSASGFTHTVSAAGRYEDIIPCGNEAFLIDDLVVHRVRRLSHHHLAGVDMLKELRRKTVDWYADHFLARDMRIWEIGNGKHYAYGRRLIPMGTSRRRAIRETIKELDRVTGKQRLFYIGSRPSTPRGKL